MDAKGNLSIPAAGVVVLTLTLTDALKREGIAGTASIMSQLTHLDEAALERIAQYLVERQHRFNVK